MLELLKSKQNELVNIQEATRKSLEQEKFVINALIPKAEKAPALTAAITPTAANPSSPPKVSTTPAVSPVTTPAVR
jgi:hypothetical protein